MYCQQFVEDSNTFANCYLDTYLVMLSPLRSTLVLSGQRLKKVVVTRSSYVVEITTRLDTSCYRVDVLHDLPVACCL